MGYFKVLAAVIKKDILLEYRTKEIVNAALIFAILFVVVFSFIMEVGTGAEKKLAGGIFWLSVTFSGILALNKTMALENESGSFQALMLAPVDKSAIFFGKVISNMLFLLVIELVLIPLFIVFYNVNIVSHPLMVVVMLFSTYAYALTGTLFAIISAATKSREMMMPVLLLPLMVPVLIGAILSTNIFLQGSNISYSYNWIKLTFVYDVIFTAVMYGIFPAIVEE